MYVYNITTKVQSAIAEEWLHWQKENHIPEIMESGKFSSYQLYRLMEQDDREGPTYITQFFADTKVQYDEYIEFYAPSLRQKAFAKWGNAFIGFRTVLRVVQ